MPELPEVETIKNDLEKKVLNRAFINVWSNTKKIIKKDFSNFKKIIKGKKINRIKRRGKNLIISLSDDYYLLIHFKMTGHFIYSSFKEIPKHTRVIFFLDNEKVLALSDVRKFAKINIFTKKELDLELSKLGPEPLTISFSEFKKRMPKKGKIKNILLKQEIITGIGNIYADEILWKCKIHPLTDISQIKDLNNLYKEMKNILKKAIKLRGSSISDYKDLQGEKGTFGDQRKVYRKENLPCPYCQNKIKRIKINNRSSCFCPSCQKI